MILFNQGHSLRLRPTLPEDAPILLKAYQDDSFIRLYRSNNTKQTEEQLKKILTERLTHNPTELNYIEYMVVHKKHGPVGVAILGDYSPLHKRAEYLIGLFEQKHRSIGYGTETTLLVLDLAFNRYQLNRIYTYVYEYNESSEKNTEKFGFKREGILEGHHYLIHEKRFVNLYINGLTEARFRSNEKIRRYSLRLLGRDVTQAPQIINVDAGNQLPIEAGQQFIEGLRAMATVHDE